MGRIPFDGSSSKEILCQNKRCEIKIPPCLCETLSDEAKFFVMELTNPNPDNRPTVREALENSWFSKIFKDEKLIKDSAEYLYKLEYYLLNYMA